MSENLMLEIIVLIRNIIALIVLDLLAVIFHKWWIVLISILFWTSIEGEKEIKNDRRKDTESN